MLLARLSVRSLPVLRAAALVAHKGEGVEREVG